MPNTYGRMQQPLSENAKDVLAEIVLADGPVSAFGVGVPGLTPRTVSNNLNWLVRFGLVERVAQADPFAHTHSTYVATESGVAEAATWYEEEVQGR